MARVLWVLLFLSSWVDASITAAWKIPIEHFAPGYKTDERVRKLEKPPGDSDFLQPGDELWDLSKALTYRITDPLRKDHDPFGEPKKIKLDQPWYGEWLVWNARSGMVVARGSWNDIFAAQKLIRFEEVPVTIRTRVELVVGGKDTVSVSLAGDDTQEASAKENGLEVDVRATNFGPPGLVDGQFFISWPAAEKNARWEVHTGVTLREGNRTKLARQGRGPVRCEVFATASREFENGVIVSAARLIESPHGTTVWPVLPDGDSRKERWGEKLLVRSYRSIFDFRSLVGLEVDSGKLPRIKVSADHAEWIRGEVIDLRGQMRGMGAKLDEPGSLAVFDLGSDRYTILGTPEDHDVCESAILHRGLIDPAYGEDLWIETNPESGGWGLTCRSGEKARIAKTSAEGNRPSFEIEPIIGDYGRTVELYYEFDFFSKGAPAGQVKSKTSVELGKPQEIASHSVGEKEEKVILTVSEN